MYEYIMCKEIILSSQGLFTIIVNTTLHGMAICVMFYDEKNRSCVLPQSEHVPSFHFHKIYHARANRARPHTVTKAFTQTQPTSSDNSNLLGDISFNPLMLNPSNAEAIFVKSTRMQRLLKTI